MGGCNGSSEREERPAGDALRLHPENSRYLLFRGKPTVLITSGEHYGALVNTAFRWRPYFEELERHGFNQTRLFSGSYVERRESLPELGYDNTLAPRPERLLSPWIRDDRGRFDLETLNPAYLERLRNFVAAAGRRGIVVELVLFSALYDYERWEASPFYVENNVNRAGSIDVRRLYTLDNAGLLRFQRMFVRKLVTELNRFDNLYFEILNEGYEEPAYAADGWERRIADTIAAVESELPNQHLIARNYARTTGPIDDPDPDISIFNFHYQRDLSDYLALNGVISFDETGFEGAADRPYRTDAWHFMLSGGGVYSNLDYSFTPTHEDGSFDVPAGAPGGGGESLRQSLAVLKRFLERFDFVAMSPNTDMVIRAPAGSTVRALVEPGRAYALYLDGGEGGTLGIEASPGRYRTRSIEPRTGRVLSRRRITHEGGELKLQLPPYDPDIALSIKRAE